MPAASDPVATTDETTASRMPDDAQPPRRRRWLQAAVVLGTFAAASTLGTMDAGAKPDDTDFSQCANVNPTSGDCEWINGILQGNNSAYFEGTSTLQRLVFEGIEPVAGDTHIVTFTADATKSGVHAYDWLTSWDQALQTLAEAGAPISNLNPCGDLGGLEALCLELHDTPNTVTVAVPEDPFVSASPDGGGPLSTATQPLIDGYERMYGDRTIRLYAADGSPITDATLTLSHSVASEGDTGDSEVLYTLRYTSASPDLLIEFGAHLAVGDAATDEAWGAGFGASSVSGGPYHVQLNQFDGDALGSMDNQLQGAAVPPRPASITITKVTEPASSPRDFAFITTGDGVSDFALDTDAGNAALAATKTFTISGDDLGVVTITEAAVAGWTLTDLECTGDSESTEDGATATLDVDAGETIACIYTNTEAELEVAECPEEQEGFRGFFSRGGEDCPDEQVEEDGDDEGDGDPLEVAGDPVAEVDGATETRHDPPVVSPQTEVRNPAPAPAADPAVSPAVEVAPMTLQQLPRTGSSLNLMRQAMLAMFLVTMGVPAMVFGRRRRTAQA